MIGYGDDTSLVDDVQADEDGLWNDTDLEISNAIGGIQGLEIMSGNQQAMLMQDQASGGGENVNFRAPEFGLSEQEVEETYEDLPGVPKESLVELIKLSELSGGRIYEDLSPSAESLELKEPTCKSKNQDLIHILDLTRFTKNSTYLNSNPLHYCVIDDDSKFLKVLITQGEFVVDQLDDKQYTAAMYAVDLKRYKCLLILIANGADPNKQDESGNSLVHRAAANGDLVTLLILKLKNLNYKLLNKLGMPPAMSAFQGKDTDVINHLWEETNDFRFLSDHVTSLGQTYLHLSAAYVDSSVLRNVLKYTSIGAIALTTKGALTPLHISVANGLIENVKELYKFNPVQVYFWDSNGDLPIHKVKSMELLTYFKELDSSMLSLANPNSGKRLIHYVSEAKLFELIVFILRSSPPSWTFEDKEGKTWDIIVGPDVKRKVLNEIKN